MFRTALSRLFLLAWAAAAAHQGHASVAWTADSIGHAAPPLAFENPSHWVASTYDPPAPTPELTPPGSDSVWFVDDFDGRILLSQPRTAATSRLGPGRVGGGDADQHVTLLIDADVTITGQERDGTGAVNPDLREMRVGGEDTTPGDSAFPLAEVIQRSGHFFMEYTTDPDDSDLKIVSDKASTGGAVWEVGGNSRLTVREGVLIGEKTGVVATGGIFRVRGSDVGGVEIGNRLLVLSRSAHWDLTEVDFGGGNVQQQVNRGKSILEFVLDQQGATPIEVDGDLALGSQYTDIFTLTPYVVPGFLRIKLSEPTNAGSGSVGSGSEEVLIRADNIASRVTAFPGSQSQDGVFFDPDRAQSNFPHRVIDRLGTGTVVADYAGVTYTWTAVYDDNSTGLESIEDAFTLTDLVISDPGGSGIHGDFDDLNGLDANDADAMQNAFGTVIGFADAQHLFDLNADQAIDQADLIQLVTHPGFANTELTDFDLDGDTDGSDLSAVQQRFGTTAGALFTDGDATLDAAVSGVDFLLTQRNFTGAVNGTQTIPEPTSIILIAAALVCVRSRLRPRAVVACSDNSVPNC